MIKQIENLPENILGFTYSDVVTGKDYETVVFPAVEKIEKKHDKMRFLCVFSEDFRNLNFAAIMDDAAVGLKHFRGWEKIAIVSDHNAINHIIKAFTFLFPGKLRIFTLSELSEAKAWISEGN